MKPMKISRLLYLAVSILMAGCSSEAELSDSTPSGGGKTPLTLNATLGTDAPTNKAGTRAAGKNFTAGDVLHVYLQHMAPSETSIVPLEDDYAQKLVTFTKGSAAMTTTTNALINQTSDFTTNAYWEDFSNSSSDATDIRTTGHGLRALYGYCYNGGNANISTNLVETTGELGWKIGATVTPGVGDPYIDQSTAAAVQHADLLWAPSAPNGSIVPYVHSDSHSGDHGTIEMAFTHAMSMVTVTLIADEGFVPNLENSFAGVTNPLLNTKITLNKANTVTQLTANVSTTFSPEVQTTADYIKNVKMCPGAYSESNQYTRDFTAIIAPGTKLKVGEQLLEITNVDGNNYKVDITDDMLAGADNKWGTGHTIHVEETKKTIRTQPGKNYHLTVTVKKTSVQVSTTLADWKELTATATGKIVFDDDDVNLVMDDSKISGTIGMDVLAVDQNEFVNNASFSLFTLKSTSSNAEATARTNASYTYATVSTFNNNEPPTSDEWLNTPKLFWENADDSFYFRALAKFNSVDAGLNNISSLDWASGQTGADVQSVSQGTIAGGHDILWGETAKHKGMSTNPPRIYDRGAPIPPRTGGVPIAFEHAMSKVTFILETSVDAAAVSLSGAQIAINDLYTSGTISIENGNITPDAITSAAISATATDSPVTNMTVDPHVTTVTVIGNFIVIPQTFEANSKVTITLENGAIYSLPLTSCKVVTTTDDPDEEPQVGDPIAAWERGKNYIYTIHIEKEKIDFRVLVKDWDAPVYGSGEANLEWD